MIIYLGGFPFWSLLIYLSFKNLSSKLGEVVVIRENKTASAL